MRIGTHPIVRAAVTLIGLLALQLPVADGIGAQTLPALTNAFLDGPTYIAARISAPVNVASTPVGMFALQDLDADSRIGITRVSVLNSGAVTGRSAILRLDLASEPDPTHRMQLAFGSSGGVIVLPRLVFNDPKYFYGGDDLGATYTPAATTFKLWAPMASQVKLVTFTDEQRNGQVITPMNRGINGTWALTVNGDLKNVYYEYLVTNLGATQVAVDPYARGVGINGDLGMVVDLAATNPPGWSQDTYRKTGRQTNASIYEVHVRDFSIAANSGMRNRGKYLAFTERSTRGPGGVSTGLDSIKQLGVTHIELLPTEGCATLDDIRGGATDPAPPGAGGRYNWCYDPKNYNVPNGAYATNPRGTTRITEFKQMVQSIHNAGLGVILDVVYNHTSSSSVFDPIVPGYFYRQDYSGSVFNFAGPAIAAERPMVRKFILDSVLYWAREYHVDGYRFDAMALLGKNLMRDIATRLRQINPDAVILGEPFSLLPTNWQNLFGQNIQDTEFTAGVQQGLRIGIFNASFRDATIGDPANPSNPAYATGDTTQLGGVQAGNVGEINYGSGLSGFARNPDESINYVSVHDGVTVWDHVNAGVLNADASLATKIRQDELATAIVFTSQGVPFMQGGDEFLRTKGGDANSYISGDQVNQLDWSRKQQYARVFAYYAGLVRLRAAHPAFRMDSAAAVRKRLRFLKAPKQVDAFELINHANGDRWKNIVVIYNPNDKPVRVSLPSGAWRVVTRAGRVGTATLGKARRSVSVPAYTMDVLHQ